MEPTTNDANLSAYELERNRTIAANNAKLRELGLETAAGEMKAHTEAKRAAAATERKERQKRMPAPEPTRMSKRVRSEKPQYGVEKIDTFGDQLDEQIEKQNRMSASAVEKAAARAEAMENARKLLEEARERMRAERKAAAPSGSKAVDGDSSGWKAEAVRRWGEGVECENGDWEGFVASRETTPAPTSPQPLLQEYYCEEPWRLLVCCALMSRVSSHETKTRCIEGFFEFCPTPTAFLEAESPDVEGIINPLGLFDSRYRTLVELSSRFLQMPIFEIGHEKGVNKIYGCGVFTVDSYHIFCKDDRSTRPDDLALKGYCSWRDAEFGKAK